MILTLLGKCQCEYKDFLCSLYLDPQNDFSPVNVLKDKISKERCIYGLQTQCTGEAVDVLSQSWETRPSNAYTIGKPTRLCESTSVAFMPFKEVTGFSE